MRKVKSNYNRLFENTRRARFGVNLRFLELEAASRNGFGSVLEFAFISLSGEGIGEHDVSSSIDH